MGLSRVVRDVDPATGHNATATNPNGQKMDLDTKLSGISTFLVSISKSVEMLKRQLGVELTKQSQAISMLTRRINNLARRQQNANPGFYVTNGPASTPNQLVTSCAQAQPVSNGGIQKLQLTSNSDPFYVLCDDDISGGGWTVIQHRFSGEVNFQRDWLEYKNGFGNLAGEFFIGLDKLHALTASSVHELLILMIDMQNVQRTAKYSLFAIGSEKDLYTLNLLGKYEGDAGDAFSYHAGSKFSTFDKDNDGWLEGNCAQAHTGAWWYNACEQSNLNGQYLSGEYDEGQTFQGMYWQDFHGPTYSLKAVKMMIRPVGAEHEQRR